jgi:hypothetical protein
VSLILEALLSLIRVGILDELNFRFLRPRYNSLTRKIFFLGYSKMQPILKMRENLDFKSLLRLVFDVA